MTSRFRTVSAPETLRPDYETPAKPGRDPAAMQNTAAQGHDSPPTRVRDETPFAITRHDRIFLRPKPVNGSSGFPSQTRARRELLYHIGMIGEYQDIPYSPQGVASAKVKNGTSPGRNAGPHECRRGALGTGSGAVPGLDRQPGALFKKNSSALRATYRGVRANFLRFCHRKPAFHSDGRHLERRWCCRRNR